ncbi:D-amino-acid transaminase [bacterium]|nr:D-amino-acid transaminase [bacterium]
MIVYYNGSYMQKDSVSISPDDRGFLFGDGTYEVIRVYNSRIFRMSDHLKRLKHSLHEIEIRSLDVAHLEHVGKTLIEKNPETAQDAVLYIQVTRGTAARSHLFPEHIEPTVYAALSGAPAGRTAIDNGLKIILLQDQRWGRCDIKSISLLANVLAAEEARKQDAYEAVFVRDSVITEGTRTNIAAVFDGTVETHPTGHRILGGITRDVVLELCHRENIPVREQAIAEARLYEADEIFLMGTTTEIGPVIRVNDREIGSGRPGPVTQRLQKSFRAVIAR